MGASETILNQYTALIAARLQASAIRRGCDNCAKPRSRNCSKIGLPDKPLGELALQRPPTSG